MNRIQELRKEAGFTQAELAKMVGVSDASINKYEKGLMNPKIDKLEKMSEIFTASIAYITGENNHRFNVNNGDYADSWDSLAQKINSREVNYNLKSIASDKAESAKILLADFDKLNESGRKEALKQVNNLTKISDYTN